MQTLFQKPLLGEQIKRVYPVTRSLLGAWILNAGTGDRVLDYSGNGNNGLLNSNTAWISSDRGSVIDFPGGANDYVNYGDKDLFTPTDAGFSVVGRFRLNVMPPATTANRMFIITKGDFPGEGEWGVHVNDYDSDFGTLTYSVWDPSGQGTRRRSATILTIDTWYHFVFTIQQSRDGMLPDCYINGILDNGTSFSNSGADTSNGTAPLLMGARADLAENAFNGVISEAYILGRVLTALEAWQLYRIPFEMFQQNKTRWFSIPAAGGISIPVVMQQMDQFDGGAML